MFEDDSLCGFTVYTHTYTFEIHAIYILVNEDKYKKDQKLIKKRERKLGFTFRGNFALMLYNFTYVISVYGFHDKCIVYSLA